MNRRRKTPPFVMFYHKWMRTPAWLALTGNEAKLLLALLSLWNGENNGELYLSNRRAAEIAGISRGTAAKALAGLEAKGFICPVIRGHFDVKRYATTWRLTMWPAFGKAATHDYLKWIPEQKA